MSYYNCLKSIATLSVINTYHFTNITKIFYYTGDIQKL